MKKFLVENKNGTTKRKKNKEPTKEEQIKDMEDWMDGMAKYKIGEHERKGIFK